MNCLVKDHERVKRLLQSTAQLEFWETTSSGVTVIFNECSKLVADQDAQEDAQESETEDFLQDADSLLLDSANTSVNPFYELMNVLYAFGVVWCSFVEDTAKVNEIMSREDIRSLLTVI